MCGSVQCGMEGGERARGGARRCREINRENDRYLFSPLASQPSLFPQLSAVEVRVHTKMLSLAPFVLKTGRIGRRRRENIFLSSSFILSHFFQLRNWRWGNGIGGRCRVPRTARRRPPLCAGQTESSTRMTATCARGPATEVSQ